MNEIDLKLETATVKSKVIKLPVKSSRSLTRIPRKTKKRLKKILGGYGYIYWRSENRVINIRELVSRQVIRNDYPEEFLNKMTNNEIKIWEKEVEIRMKKDHTLKKFPDWNAEFLARTIDSGILYELFKMK